MKNLIFNAVFIGGIIPMLCFGVLNFLQKVTSQKLSAMGWLLGLAVGGILVGTIYSLLSNQGQILNEITKKEFYLALMGGLFWGTAIFGLNLAYTKYNANASQIMPITMSSMFVTALLAIIFLQEKVVLWKIITGAGLIFAGGMFLI